MSICTSEPPSFLPSQQQLLEHLECELSSASKLAKLLDKENELLRITNIEILDELNSVVEQKQACINQLEENAKHRDIWTEFLRNQTTESKQIHSERQRQSIKLKLWLNLLDDNLTEKWNKIEQYILICKRLNAINGRLIGFRKQRVKRIEEMLFGNSSATTYSQNGTTVKSRGSQNSIRA